MSKKADVPDWKLVVREALAFLKKRGAWTQRGWGFDKYGDRLDFLSDINFFASRPEELKCLCVGGAIRLGGLIAFTNNVFRRNEAIEQVNCKLRLRVGASSVVNWNDEKKRTKREVIQVLTELAR